MNRRGFLRGLFSGAAVAAVDPEALARLLHVPGQRLISIPAPRIYRPSPAILMDLNRFTIEYVVPRSMEPIFKIRHRIPGDSTLRDIAQFQTKISYRWSD